MANCILKSIPLLKKKKKTEINEENYLENIRKVSHIPYKVNQSNFLRQQCLL